MLVVLLVWILWEADTRWVKLARTVIGEMSVGEKCGGNEGWESCQTTTAYVTPGSGQGRKVGALWMWCRQGLLELTWTITAVRGLPGRSCCPHLRRWSVTQEQTTVGCTTQPLDPGQLHAPPRSWRSVRPPAAPVVVGDHWQEVWAWRLSSDPRRQLPSPQRILGWTTDRPLF